MNRSLSQLYQTKTCFMLLSARLCMSWTSSFEPPVSSYSIRAIMYMYVSYIHPFHGALRMILGLEDAKYLLKPD